MEEKINVSENLEQQTDSCEMPQSVLRAFDVTKRDNGFVLAVIISSLITSFLGLWGGFQIGFTVSVIFMLVSFTAYLLNKKIKLNFFAVSCLILSMGVSFVFAVTSNGAIRFWSFVSITVLTLVWFTALSCDRKPEGDLGLLGHIFSPLFRGMFFDLDVTLKSVISGNIKNTKKLGMSVLGLIISIPALFIIVPLLVSSDQAFSGMADMFAANILLGIFKIAVGLFISIFLVSYGLSLKKNAPKTKERVEHKGIENAFLISFLSVISICYLAFLFSQLAYFFSAFRGFLPEDYKFNVASYARRGFFEMSAIAGINFALVFISVLISNKKEGKLCGTLKALCTFVCCFTLVIIATALSKMVLYIDELGMTRLRITTSAFMVFLAVVFVSLMLRIFIPKVAVLKTGVITAAIVLIILGTVNVNHVVASYNFNAYKYERLKSIDVETISELGEEGVPYLIKLTNSKDEDVKNEAISDIRCAIEDMYETDVTTYASQRVYKVGEKRYNSIGQWSIARSRAYKALDGYMKKHPEILTEELYGEEGYENYEAYYY